VPLKMDICGVVGGGFGDRSNKNSWLTSGFITSPNYPNRYSPDTKCRCILNASSDQAQTPAEILLQVLDYDLSSLPSDFSPADWVEYVISGRQRWADGTRITGDVTGDVIHTRADVVEVDFRSDAAHEQRGFWIMYSGKRQDFESGDKIDSGNFNSFQYPHREAVYHIM